MIAIDRWLDAFNHEMNAIDRWLGAFNYELEYDLPISPAPVLTMRRTGEKHDIEITQRREGNGKARRR